MRENWIEKIRHGWVEAIKRWAESVQEVRVFIASVVQA